MSKFKPWIILGCILLSSCRAQSGTIQVNEPKLWEVAYPMSLGWLEPALNGCTLLQPGHGLSVSKKAYQDLLSGESEISLTWGAPDTWIENTYILGYDELVYIINPQNPQPSLTRDQLKRIISGQIKTWGEIESGTPDDREIKVWGYSDGNEIRSLSSSILGTSLQKPEAQLAPAPGAMLESISTNPDAIGYITRRWVRDDVKIISIEGLESASVTKPIVAHTSGAPDNDLKKWLACLQQSIEGR